MAATATATTHEEKARRAVRGAFFGFFVDMFDIYLPVVVLTPAIEYSSRRSCRPARRRSSRARSSPRRSSAGRSAR